VSDHKSSPCLRSSRFSLRGVESGTLSTEVPDSLVQVVLLLDPLNPDWLLACLGCRWMNISTVFVDGPCSEELQQVLTTSTVLFTEWERRKDILVPATGLPLLLLSNKRVSSTAMGRCERCGVQLLVSSRGFRSLTPLWHCYSAPISHADVGGVATAVTPLFWAHPGVNTASFLLQTVTPRDLSTILECGAQVTGPMKIPAECPSLRAANLGSLAFPIYHGNGLLPALPTSATKIVAPNQRVRKGFWGVRTLTNTELGHAYDIGDRMLNFVPVVSKFALLWLS